MTRIFISYRRDDSAGYVGRIHDKLTARFGKNAVFTDIDAIPPGADFVQVIQQAVGSSDVLLAVIGKQWFLPGTDGQPRLYDPNDFVRLEIATALSRGITVIPVLVRDASMPHINQLPPDLQVLARRNAHVVSDRNFHGDVDELIKAIASQKKKRPTAPRQRSSVGRVVRWLAFVFLILAGLIIGSTFVLNTLSDEVTPDEEEEVERIEPIPGLWQVTRSFDDNPNCADALGWSTLEEVWTDELDFELAHSEEFDTVEFTILPYFEDDFGRGYLASDDPNLYALEMPEMDLYSDLQIHSPELMSTHTSIEHEGDTCIFDTSYEFLEAEE